MRVKHKFSSHRTRNLKNIKKQKQKYPDLIEKIIEKSDIILEILDARFVEETRNIAVEKKIDRRGKKIIYVINKFDLKKERVQTELYPNVKVSCKERRGVKELRDKIKKIASTMEKSDQITVGVLGYPNTGKSSIINLLIGKNSAKTGSEAGFTKGIQKLRLASNIVLLDSPGVIPLKEYSSFDEEARSKHTKVSAISHSQTKNPELAVLNIMKEFPSILQEYYKIDAENSEKLIENLGRKINFLKKGNEVDVDKTSRKILRDWQEGKIKL